MQYISVCCIRSFFLLILSLQITQLPLLSSPSGHEQTQKRYPFVSGQTPILPHYIIVPSPHNGREIPVFFSSRFQREKDRVKKRPCNVLEWLQSFLHIFLSFSFISLVISCFLPFFIEKREKKIRKKKEPYRASQSLIEASCDSSYDTRKNEMGARSNEGKSRKMIGRAWEKEKKKEGKIPTRKVVENYNYNGKVYSS